MQMIKRRAVAPFVQQRSAFPVPGHVGHGNYALARLPSRDTHLRRQIYRQWWHEQIIARAQTGDITYFRTLGNNERVSNIEVAGSIPVRKAFLLKKLVIWPSFGTSGPDQAVFFDRVIVRLKIEGDNAYRFLAFTLTQGTGFVNSPLPVLGEPAPHKTFDLGMVPLGAGQSFDVTLHFPNALNAANNMRVTSYLHTLTDEPIS